MNKTQNRRQFFRSYFFELFAGAEAAFSDELLSFAGRYPETIRPPGADKETVFLKLCKRCGACIKACPHHAIIPLLMASNFIKNTPTLRHGNSFCRFCEDFPCIQACKHGALRAEKHLTERIATAEIIVDQCQRSQEVSCQLCFDICQKLHQAIRLEPEKPPAILPGLCKGCGACLAVCPVEPQPAIKLVR